MDDLLAKFLPRFVAVARTRVAEAQRDQAATPKSADELHALAGEAGLLGLTEVFPLAKACEQQARRLHASRADAEVETFVAALRQLERLIEGLAVPNPPAGDA
jgi:HPt (histidine-containing phosphotransfer) domain-containing protein